MLRGANVVLGVTGSIAAFKAVEVLRALTLEAGARVTVILTRHATEFVRPLTFSVLSGRPCLVDQFAAEEMRASFIPPDVPGRVPLVHIDLAQRADLVVVAPASANLLGKVAAGIADDLLTVTIMATAAPVLFAPAMNTRMWENPIVRANAGRLATLGYRFVGPDAGDLACGVGPGRLAEPAAIVAACAEAMARQPRRGALAGRTVLVTAGRTEEPIDPVRTLSNRSSGKMGFALAEAARDQGAHVVLVTGATSVPPPPGIEVHEAATAEAMRERVLAELERADALLMAAAVADYRPKAPRSDKIRRQAAPPALELEPTADILAEAAKRKGKRVMVGFALEAGDDGVEVARAKLAAKGVDLMVLNRAAAIGADTNQVVLVDRDGARPLPELPKREVAELIVGEVARRLGGALAGS
jgi:phosphopantothenoylcysteine decarboxylase/phosphopantothenate--cysteine ligase